MKYGKLHMTVAQYEAHQRRHGFGPPQDTSTTNKTTPTPKRGAGQAMNKTEREFSLMLERDKRCGVIDGWMFQGIKLRLADGCWYTPDFMAWKVIEVPDLAHIYRAVDGLKQYRKFVIPTIYEVKGAHIWDDAKVKFKVAKEHCTWASFEMWQKTRALGWTQIG